MAKTPPDVMTIGQLSLYLQITHSTLYKLVQAGRVPGRKVGRQWRFHREVIDEWLAQGSLRASLKTTNPAASGTDDTSGRQP